MAKIQPSHLISSISGKLCKKDREYIALNKRTGQMYSAVHHSYGIQPNSEKQQAVKAEFKTKSQFASQWWNTNKPSATVPDGATVTDASASGSKGTEAYKAIIKAYKSQTKIGNPYSFLRSLVTDDLKVILGGKDLTGGIVPGQSGGGTSTDQGGGSGTLE